MRHAILIGCVLASFFLCRSGLSTQATLRSFYTMENLNFAYSEETGTREKYLAYAAMADQEGYPFVAGLFRAIAQSEEIHARNHSAAIKRLGGTPKAFAISSETGSTSQNLKQAVSNESFQWRKLYTPFIEQAKYENMFAALRTFNYARQSENQHANLLRKVLEHREDWNAPRRAFFVSPVCGYVSGSLPKERCQICGTARERFLKVV